ncbi:MAG: hypothetical protein ABI690_28250 [Chloroflexota bacterium]
MTGNRHWKISGLVILMVIVIGLVATQPALALSINGLNVTLDCTSWSYNAYDFTTDRDNTGANAEAYDIIITDGAGTLLHVVSNNGVGLGGPIYDGPTTNIIYNQGVAPLYNPLTFTWTSRSGNGYNAQIAYTTSGNCLGLPTFGASKGSSSKVIEGEVQFDPGDDRLNRETKDRAAPVAIYCVDWGIEIRVIDYPTSRGIDPPAITALTEQIDSVGVPDVNTLLGDHNGVQLYRLTTGEYAVFTHYANENKPYIFVWDQCPVPTKTYHAAV